MVTVMSAVFALTLTSVLGTAAANAATASPLTTAAAPAKATLPVKAAPAATRTIFSTDYYNGDWRLGPVTTRTQDIGFELSGYRRFAGLTSRQFLATYWDASTGSWDYPPDNGYLLVGGETLEFVLTLTPGQRIDRYGSPNGTFLAPLGTPYAARSIPPSNLDDSDPAYTCDYYAYKVLKPFEVESGPIAPGFGQAGLGLQYQVVPSLLPGDPPGGNVNWLVSNGYLAVTN